MTADESKILAEDVAEALKPALVALLSASMQQIQLSIHLAFGDRSKPPQIPDVSDFLAEANQRIETVKGLLGKSE